MILLLGFLMMTGVAVAQQLQVQGKVTDATGEGLIGASVLVKGTTSGVITDIDGNYVLLNVNPDAILIFSYVGYQTQELNVSGRNKIDVVLHDDQQVLEEVVVVGYGSLSKKEVSSSIGTIFFYSRTSVRYGCSISISRISALGAIARIMLWSNSSAS